jgi:hypothetical protein
MNITFQNEANVLLWCFAKLIVTFQAIQYLFAAQCVWWISAIIELQSALVYFIDNYLFRSETRIEERQPPLVALWNELIPVKPNKDIPKLNL